MICPNCQNDVVVTEQHYGALYTCSSCQAVYFINFDGKPEYGEVPSEFDSGLEPAVDSVDMVSFDNKIENQFGDSLNQQTAEASDVAISSLENAFPSVPENISSNVSSDLSSDLSSSVSAFSDAAKEISDYGNTEVQLAGLNYDLTVSGLDSQELMGLFKEAIEDSKFGWDSNDLMRSVKNGTIFFARLSPVKAYILAKRLQFLDVEKHWKQNVLS